MTGRGQQPDPAPPWPGGTGLAPGAAAPATSGRQAFVLEATGTYGDDAHFARERWNAAARLMADGDMDGLAGDRGEPERSALGRVLAAWLLTPREDFLPPQLRAEAYRPCALPIGGSQTISAPYMVSRMTAALNPGPDMKVLEIGTGSGYQAAMLSVLTPHVRSIEYVASLAAGTTARLAGMAHRRPWLESIRVRCGNGYNGWAEGAPYDRIIVTCAIDHVPPALIEQLTPGGILILPLGPVHVQRLIAVRRPPDGSTDPRKAEAADVYGDGTRVAFVPFIH